MTPKKVGLKCFNTLTICHYPSLKTNSQFAKGKLGKKHLKRKPDRILPTFNVHRLLLLVSGSVFFSKFAVP